MTDTALETLPEYLADGDALTREESAEDLGVTVSTLASWRATGKGPSYWKYGRAIFYSRRANAEWKRAQRVDPREIVRADR
jgi:hypothetical protein